MENLAIQAVFLVLQNPQPYPLSIPKAISKRPALTWAVSSDVLNHALSLTSLRIAMSKTLPIKTITTPINAEPTAPTAEFCLVQQQTHPSIMQPAVAPSRVAVSSLAVSVSTQET